MVVELDAVLRWGRGSCRVGNYFRQIWPALCHVPLDYSRYCCHVCNVICACSLGNTAVPLYRWFLRSRLIFIDVCPRYGTGGPSEKGPIRNFSMVLLHGSPYDYGSTSLLCAKLAHLVFNLYLTLDFRGDFVEVSDNQLF